MLQVERVKERTVRLRQSRYLLDQENEGKGERSPYNYKWDVYLTYITNIQSESDAKHEWLSANDEFVEITVPSGK